MIPFQSGGTGAVTEISFLLTGWMNPICLAINDMPPSLLERGAPYLRSPLMQQPMPASWQRIW